jgi:hypothetical protein
MGSIDIDEMSFVYFQLNNSLLFIPILIPKPLLDKCRRTSCSDGNAVIRFLARHMTGEAQFLEIFKWKIFFKGFNFLETENIDVIVPMLQPFQSEYFSCFDRINIPRTNLHCDFTHFLFDITLYNRKLIQKRVSNYVANHMINNYFNHRGKPARNPNEP